MVARHPVHTYEIRDNIFVDTDLSHIWIVYRVNTVKMPVTYLPIPFK